MGAWWATLEIEAAMVTDWMPLQDSLNVKGLVGFKKVRRWKYMSEGYKPLDRGTCYEGTVMEKVAMAWEDLENSRHNSETRKIVKYEGIDVFAYCIMELERPVW